MFVNPGVCIANERIPVPSCSGTARSLPCRAKSERRLRSTRAHVSVLPTRQLTLAGP